jgi:hypothetical protein
MRATIAVLVISLLCTCSEAGKKCESASECDDSNPCTDDSCDPDVGCLHENNTARCDDNDACTQIDLCSQGTCLPGIPVDCDDGNVCTDDICSGDGHCFYENNTAACDDHNACTNPDTCQDGVCTGPTVCTGEVLVENMILYDRRGAIVPFAHGLAVYFECQTSVDAEYNADTIQWAADTSWDEMLRSH